MHRRPRSCRQIAQPRRRRGEDASTHPIELQARPRHAGLPADPARASCDRRCPVGWNSPTEPSPCPAVACSPLRPPSHAFDVCSPSRSGTRIRCSTSQPARATSPDRTQQRRDREAGTACRSPRHADRGRAGPQHGQPRALQTEESSSSQPATPGAHHHAALQTRGSSRARERTPPRRCRTPIVATTLLPQATHRLGPRRHAQHPRRPRSKRPRQTRSGPPAWTPRRRLAAHRDSRGPSFASARSCSDPVPSRTLVFSGATANVAA